MSKGPFFLFLFKFHLTWIESRERRDTGIGGAPYLLHEHVGWSKKGRNPANYPY
jgi:hypothetical protein